MRFFPFILCLLMIGCSRSNDPKEYYQDFSLFEGKGIGRIKNISLLDKGTSYLELGHVNDSIKEIYLKGYKHTGAEKIVFRQVGSNLIYNLIYPSVIMESLYWCFCDSTFKRYTFGLQMENSEGPITSSFSIIKNHQIGQYKFFTFPKDTVNFWRKIASFDKSSNMKFIDSSIIDFHGNVSTVNEIMKWESGIGN